MFFKNRKYNKLIEEARSYVSKQDFKNAIKIYEEAFKIKTILKDYIMYGCLLIDLNELNKAEPIFKELDEQFDFYEIHFSLGVIYEKTNRKYDAMEQYKKVIKAEPNFDQAYFSLAYMYDEMSEDNKENLESENASYWVYL